MVVGLLPRPAAAIDLGVRAEAGVSVIVDNVASGPSNRTTQAAVGVLAEQRWSTLLLGVTLWEDAQKPLLYGDGNYLPVSIGVRVGPDLWSLRPYFGPLIVGDLHAGTIPHAICGIPCEGDEGPLLGVGADLGLDWRWHLLRFGVEARGSDMVAPPGSSRSFVPLNTFLLQGLASVGAEF